MPRQIKIKIFHAHYGALCEMPYSCFSSSLSSLDDDEPRQKGIFFFCHHTHALTTQSIKTRDYVLPFNRFNKLPNYVEIDFNRVLMSQCVECVKNESAQAIEGT